MPAGAKSDETSLRRRTAEAKDDGTSKTAAWAAGAAGVALGMVAAAGVMGHGRAAEETSDGTSFLEKKHKPTEHAKKHKPTQHAKKHKPTQHADPKRKPVRPLLIRYNAFMKKQKSGEASSDDERMPLFQFFAIFARGMLAVQVILGIGSSVEEAGYLGTPLVMIVAFLFASETTRVICDICEIIEEDGIADGTFFVPGSSVDYMEKAVSKDYAKIANYCALGLGSLGSVGTGMLQAENLSLQFPITKDWPLWETPDDSMMWWFIMVMPILTIVYCYVEFPQGMWSNYVGLAFTFVCLVLVIAGTYAQTHGEHSLDKDFPMACRVQTDWQYWDFFPTNHDGMFETLAQMAALFSMCFFCFGIMGDMPGLRTKLAPVDRPRAPLLAFATYFLCTGIFILMMLVAYSSFGNLGPDNLLEGLKTNRPAGWWATVEPWATGEETALGDLLDYVVIADLLLLDTIFVPGALGALEALVPKLAEQKWAACGLLIAVRIGGYYIASSYLTFLEFASAVFVVPICTFVPVYAFHNMMGKEIRKSHKKQPSGLRTTMHIIVAVFGIYVAVGGAIGSIERLIYPSHASHREIGHFPRPGISDACKQAYYLATNQTLAASPAANQTLHQLPTELATAVSK